MVTKNYLSIQKLKSDYPNCYLEYIKINGQAYTNFNTAIDSLLFSFGIGVVLKQIYSKSEKFLGYQSFIKYYPDNKVNIESGESMFIEDYKKFKDPEKANKTTFIEALKILEYALARKLR